MQTVLLPKDIATLLSLLVHRHSGARRRSADVSVVRILHIKNIKINFVCYLLSVL